MQSRVHRTYRDAELHGDLVTGVPFNLEHHKHRALARRELIQQELEQRGALPRRRFSFWGSMFDRLGSAIGLLSGANPRPPSMTTGDP
jgi:hypothetical protein